MLSTSPIRRIAVWPEQEYEPSEAGMIAKPFALWVLSRREEVWLEPVLTACKVLSGAR